VTSLESILTEARAKIFWGEEPKSVQGLLVASGVANEAQAKALVGEYVRERNKSARAEGLKRIIIGGVMIAISGLLLWGYFLLRIPHYIGHKAAYLFAVPAVLGLAKLSKGITQLINPALKRGAY